MLSQIPSQLSTTSGNDWVYPVLWVNELGGIRVAESDSQMFRGTKEGIKHGNQTSTFVDSNLGRWNVLSVRFIKNRPLLSEWPQYLFTGMGSIDLETKFVGKVAIEDVIDLVCSTLDKNIEFWSSAGDVEQLKTRARASENLIQLASIFGACD